MGGILQTNFTNSIQFRSKLSIRTEHITSSKCNGQGEYNYILLLLVNNMNQRTTL